MEVRIMTPVDPEKILMALAKAVSEQEQIVKGKGFEQCYSQVSTEAVRVTNARIGMRLVGASASGT